MLWQVIKPLTRVEIHPPSMFGPIPRNRGYFAPVINCQQNPIFKMLDKHYRSQRKRIPYDILNNLRKLYAFGSILQCKNRPFYDCLSYIAEVISTRANLLH